MSKYQTPNDELEASCRALRGEKQPDVSNESMQWGNQLEPLILAEAAKRLQLADLVMDYGARYHDELPLACSLDGTGDGRGQVVTSDSDAGIYVIGQDSITLDGVGVLEAKLTAMEPEDMPPLWRGPVQLQAQMDIMQAKWGAVCTLYKGTQLRIFLFAPHPATVERIRQVTLDFDRRLQIFKSTGVMDYYPPASGERWPEHRGPYPVDDEPVALSGEAEALADQIVYWRAQTKAAEEHITKAEDRLKELLGAATKGTAGRFVLAWPTRSYKAQPEKVVPAKEAYTIRQSTVTIKEAK